MAFYRRSITSWELRILKTVIPLMLLLFIGLMGYSMLKPSPYIRLTYSSEVTMKVIKMTHYKGTVILNDSIVIPYNCPEIVLENQKVPNSYRLDTIRKFKIGANFRPPFQIIKPKDSEMLCTIDGWDTAYFRLNGAKEPLNWLQLLRKSLYDSQ
ncbi:hypothetical protein [Ascidiimonas sp. W6]|uniref:hypothetical protein n=1 Tax=Ascidiimonas meishanensis TaxID=3128903 RepID=UPI0030EE6329